MSKILKKLKNLFSQSDGEIDALKAKRIQKAHNLFVKKRLEAKNDFTPPYLIIKEHFFDSNSQIAKAAIFNVTQIAINKNDYKKDILVILENLLDNKDISDDVKSYTLEAIDSINQN